MYRVRRGAESALDYLSIYLSIYLCPSIFSALSAYMRYEWRLKAVSTLLPPSETFLARNIAWDPFVVRLADGDRTETPRLQDISLQLQSPSPLLELFRAHSEDEEVLLPIQECSF